MGKLDWTKVEQLISKGLRKIKKEKLLKEADEATRRRLANISPKSVSKEEIFTGIPEKKALIPMFKALKRDLMDFKKEHPATYEEIKSTGLRIKNLEEHLEAFSNDDWQALIVIRQSLRQARIDLAGGSALEADNSRVTKELEQLEKQGKFRFGTNKKWDNV
jgi:hypothetical protein